MIVGGDSCRRISAVGGDSCRRSFAASSRRLSQPAATMMNHVYRWPKKGARRSSRNVLIIAIIARRANACGAGGPRRAGETANPGRARHTDRSPHRPQQFFVSICHEQIDAAQVLSAARVGRARGSGAVRRQTDARLASGRLRAWDFSLADLPRDRHHGLVVARPPSDFRIARLADHPPPVADRAERSIRSFARSRFCPGDPCLRNGRRPARQYLDHAGPARRLLPPARLGPRP